jgi:hypothetical protein
VCQAGQPLKVVGPQTGPRAELLPAGARVVGLRFRPGAAPAVLGLPASELAALTVDADELWGAPARAIGERVAGSTSVQAVVSALETAVVSRLAQARQPDKLVAELVRRVYAGSADSIAALASSLYVSERQPWRVARRGSCSWRPRSTIAASTIMRSLTVSSSTLACEGEARRV